MATFYMLISDGKSAEIAIDADNAHEATNDALNALSQFALQRFPPPEAISITVSNAERSRVATLKLAFTIDYAQGVVM